MRDRGIQFKLWTHIIRRWPWWWGRKWLDRRRDNLLQKWKAREREQ